MPGLQFYMDAYRDLLTDRPIGLEPGPIPWSSIQRYGESCGFTQDETEVLKSHIRALENEDRAIENAKKGAK
jgi:hypothetical protein